MKPFFNLLTESDGEGKETGEPREKRDEFSVHRISSSLEMILLGFHSLHMLLAHPLVLPRVHSAVMSVQIPFFQGRHHLLQRLELASHIRNQMYCAEASYIDEPEGIYD